MKKFIISMVSLVLVLVLFSAVAFAEGTAYRIVTQNERDGLRLRSTMKNGDVLCSVPKGTIVYAQEEYAQWIKVSYNGIPGYLYMGYLEEVNPPKVIGEKVVTAKPCANVRSEPTTASSVLGSLSFGTKVNVLDYCGTWTKVLVNHQVGYIRSDLLSSSTATSSSSTSSLEVTGARYVTASSLNIRASASTSSEVIDSVSCGTKLQFIKNYNDQWAQILFNGSACYASREYLSEYAPSSAPGVETSETIRRRVTASKLNIRQQPSTDAALIGALLNGEFVPVQSISNGWAKLIQGGYVSADYLE